MKLGLELGYSQRDMDIPMDLVLEAERLGYDSCWTAEAWGSDAVTPLAWIAAQTKKIKLGAGIMQVPARTPAMCAMTAMTLDKLSGERFILGLGPSGPQVIEGWHGVPYQPSLTRLKEYVQIVRAILQREAPLEFSGRCYQLPYTGEGSSGQGIALKSILHGRATMKIYTAATTPAGIEAAAEVADGFLPILCDPERFDVFEAPIEAGLKKRGGKDLHEFEILPSVTVNLGNNLQDCLDAYKPNLALYIGGMGSRRKNFYKDIAVELGFEAESEKIQELYLSGHKKEAIAAVPNALVDAVTLSGPKERVAERIGRWKSTGSSTLIVITRDVSVLRLMAELVL